MSLISNIYPLPGPVLSTNLPDRNSVNMLAKILKGEMMAKIPNDSMSIIDVRDLAALELAALRKEDAKGRYFCVLKSFHWREIMEALHAVRPAFAVPPKGYADDVKEVRPTQFDHTRKESLGVKLRDLNTIMAEAVDHLKTRGVLE